MALGEEMGILMIWWPSRFYRLTCQLLETGNLHFWGQIGPLKPSQAFSSFEALLTHCWPPSHNTKTRNVNLNTTMQKYSPIFRSAFLPQYLCTHNIKICIYFIWGFWFYGWNKTDGIERDTKTYYEWKSWCLDIPNCRGCS